MVLPLRTLAVSPVDLKFVFLTLTHKGSPMLLHIHINKTVKL